MDGRWRGWFMQKGKLYAPDLADGFEPNAIRSLPYLKGAVASYRAERDAARSAAGTSGVVWPMRPHRQEDVSAPRLEGSAAAAIADTAAMPTADQSPPLRPAPSLESPAPSALAEDGRGREPTGRPDGRTKGSSTTLATLRAPRTDSGRSPGSGRSDGRSSGRHRSRSGIDAQERTLTAAPEVFFNRQGDEAVQGQAQISRLRDSAGVQVGRETQQKGHDGTPESDITTISSAGKMISPRYQIRANASPAQTPKGSETGSGVSGRSGKKVTHHQSIAHDWVLTSAPASGEGSCTLFGYIDKPQEGGAPGAARTQSASAPAAARTAASSRQSRIIDIMLKNMFHATRAECR